MLNKYFLAHMLWIGEIMGCWKNHDTAIPEMEFLSLLLIL